MSVQPVVGSVVVVVLVVVVVEHMDFTWSFVDRAQSVSGPASKYSFWHWERLLGTSGLSAGIIESQVVNTSQHVPCVTAADGTQGRMPVFLISSLEQQAPEACAL